MASEGKGVGNGGYNKYSINRGIRISIFPPKRISNSKVFQNVFPSGRVFHSLKLYFQPNEINGSIMYGSLCNSKKRKTIHFPVVFVSYIIVF